MSIEPGIYVAKVFEHAIGETKAGLPQAVITFKFGGHSIKYYGSFSPKAAPWTIKALIACGLEGQNPAGPLKIGKEVSITIAEDVNLQGQPVMKVRWVNPISGIKNVIAPDAAKAKLADLEGAVLAARADLGVGDDSEIPF
jgi:hypothetical protein